ncbi:MAG: phosphoribosylformylglycinamidine cyclo-ligase [Planctomycetes bacterium]|jgi:phosphoribosylformylglycinamidine cyclo-ligase|nr:phosphoribosylformylglycinamidine cyclo-ligase [Planctomycetota bacterium]MCL4731167.1 phosphoribosylformylglycinamidine cyclo-ligase [Planctomycetota bacterium]
MAKTRAKGLTYADAGVNFATHDKLVTEIFRRVRSTYGPRVLEVEDGFGGLFSLQNNRGLFSRNWRNPVLVACTDGVGTKLKLAFETGKHDTVGIDCVAMSVNDMLCMGAEPLFFLDYIATGRKDLKVLLPLVSGVVEGCKQSGCALIGGETAEMPGFYPPGEYDIAGFGVGVVERKSVLTGTGIKPGDVILGLASSGLHSNGFSLVRKIVKKKKWRLGAHITEFGRTLGEELLEPTMIYARPVGAVLGAYRKPGAVAGIANITGGGFLDNIPRILPPACDAVIDTAAWTPPPVFRMLQKAGNVDRREMYNVFNMGIGMVLVCPPRHADAVAGRLESFRHKGLPRVKTRVIGHIRAGQRRVILA